MSDLVTIYRDNASFGCGTAPHGDRALAGAALRSVGPKVVAAVSFAGILLSAYGLAKSGKHDALAGGAENRAAWRGRKRAGARREARRRAEDAAQPCSWGPTRRHREAEKWFARNVRWGNLPKNMTATERLAWIRNFVAEQRAACR